MVSARCLTTSVMLVVVVVLFIIETSYNAHSNGRPIIVAVVDAFDVKSSPPQSSKIHNVKSQSRRQIINSTIHGFVAASIAVSGLIPTKAAAVAAAAATTTTTARDTLDEFRAYTIIPDDTSSLNPSLKSVKWSQLVKRLASLDNRNGGALWLGEHHNSFKDHHLQKELIEAIYQERANNGNDKKVGKETPERPMAIGLEQVQVQFQPVLDSYIAGKISLDDMKFQTQWEKRWFWDFNNYAPIFETAQKLQIPLVALNVNSEDFADVQQGGLAALPPKKLRQYIKDPQGFAAFALQNEFRDYVDYVISPSYDMHQRMGLLKTTMSGIKLENDISYKNFLTGRLLWDESMAGAAHSWIKANPGGLMVGLVGADHVKFQDGIPGRFVRLGGAWSTDKGRVMSSTSVILNPTVIDTRPAGSMAGVAEADSSRYPERLALQLRYVKSGVQRTDEDIRRLPENTGGVLPLADYIVLG